MKCSFKDCKGTYERREVLHTVRWGGSVIVFDHVPAEVCTVCGDVLFAPATLKALNEALSRLKEPVQTVPLYEFQEIAG